ncbi:MAG: hypothetical protein J6Z38_00360, partial [Lachnospiraceae bacterium]|nr:hypothetical protein [Lachnospiraceae bacterium]
ETADGTVYQPGDALIVNPEYVKDGEIPLTAIWEEVPPTGERTAAPFWTLLLFASIGGLMFAGKRRCSSEE